MNILKNIPKSSYFVAASLGVYLANKTMETFCGKENPNFVCQSAEAITNFVAGAQACITSAVGVIKGIEKLYKGIQSYRQARTPVTGKELVLTEGGIKVFKKVKVLSPTAAAAKRAAEVKRTASADVISSGLKIQNNVSSISRTLSEALQTVRNFRS